MKAAAYLVSILLCWSTLLAQEVPSRIPADKRKSEIALLQQALLNLHPGLYRYNSPAQINACFNELNKKVSGNITDHQYFILLSQLTAKIKCGHTYLNPWNQKKEVMQTYFSASYLPFLFRVIDRRFIITHNLSGKAFVRPGDEIISINGIRTPAIFDSLWTVSRSDGNNGSGKKIDNMNLVPADIDSMNYAMFDIFFPLFFPKNFYASSYTVVIKPYHDALKKITVKALSKQERQQAYTRQYGEIPIHEKNWVFKFLTPQTAYFRIGDFETWEWQTDYKKYLDSIFNTLDLARPLNLIIDIRGNEGGADEARNELLAHILNKPFGCDNPIRKLYRFLHIPDELLPYVSSWNKEVKKPKDEKVYQKTTAGLYEKTEMGQQPCIPVSPRPIVFKGKVFLLTNPNNSSTTFTLADIFQTMQRGIIIGEQTGGTKQGLNGGQFLLLGLPYSKIEIDIPVIWQAPARARPDEGVKPDFIVRNTQKDITLCNDSQLSFVLQLISKF